MTGRFALTSSAGQACIRLRWLEPGGFPDVPKPVCAKWLVREGMRKTWLTNIV